MKTRLILFLCGAGLLPGNIEVTKASDKVSGIPDIGLIAPFDWSSNALDIGTTEGDFENWFPGAFPDYSWVRLVQRVHAGGLFKVDYAINRKRGTPGHLIQESSILLFRPDSRPGDVLPWESARSNSSHDRHQSRLKSQSVTRSRQIAALIRDCLLGARFYSSNAADYSFEGSSNQLAFAAESPCLASPDSGDQYSGPHRVQFRLEAGPRGITTLVMEQVPTPLARMGDTFVQRYLVARDVTQFDLHYWMPATSQWVDTWPYSNVFPKMVKIEIGLGRKFRRPNVSRETAISLAAIDASAVPPAFQFDLPNIPPGTLPPRASPNPHIQDQVDGPTFTVAAGKLDPPASEIAGDCYLTTSNTGAIRKGAAIHPSSVDSDFEWLGRSGVEYACWLLAMEGREPDHPYDSLRNRWAGGPGNPGSPAVGIPIDNIKLGSGSFSIRIRDRQQRVNLNRADESMISKGLWLAGIEPEHLSASTDAILDWLDGDDEVRPEGAESDYYLSLPSPYRPRNGPFDEISDLRYVRGFTLKTQRALADLFTTVSGPAVNINTAPARVLQVLPAIDENVAAVIIQARAGPDGLDGTVDDAPFRSAGEVMTRVPGFPLDPSLLYRYLSVRSVVFEVDVEVKLRGRARSYSALLFREGVTWRSVSTRILYMNRGSPD